MINLLSRLTAIFSIGLLAASCGGSDDGPETLTDDPSNNNTMAITFENSTFTGIATVTYTDGSVIEAEFENGVCRIPDTGNEKTIARLKPENQDVILIGRKEGASIILNYNNNILSHRAPVGSMIPIGTYAEFQLINNNTETLSKNYKLETGLDFMNVNWIPIGANATYNELTGTFEGAFMGNFDGNNHEIHNIKVETLYYGGLFSFVIATSDDNYIKNIVLKSGSIKTTSNGSSAGGIVAHHGHAGSVDDIYGGHTISNCINYATIDANSSSVSYHGQAIGGIAAYSSGKIINCKNYGPINSASKIGGIAAHAYTLENCHNYADLNYSHSNITYIGGIAGEAAIIKNCSNSGNLGYDGTNSHPSDSGLRIGGLVGRGSECYNSFNTGTIHHINRKGYTGGIAGELLGLLPSVIKGCFNSGSITGTSVIGGIAAFGHSSAPDVPLIIEHCYNTGSIRNISSGNSLLRASGGIIGGVTNVSANPIVVTIKNCYNTGSLTTVNNPGYTNRVGGIIGHAYFNGVNSSLITFNYWKDVSGDNAEYALGRYITIDAIGEPSNTGCSIFSATSWPSAAQGWNIGNGAGNAYWKSLGSWNNGNPDYPRLWFEN